MGCTNSSTNNVMENNPLTAQEIQARIEAPSECKQLVIGGVTMRYAWVSQRGYYPDAIDKDNQDAFAVLPNFGKSGTTDQAFMGVFDGHGRDGHHCARYVRDNLPNNILDGIERISAPSIKSADIRAALRDAHILTNEKMHAQKKFDDSLSGTTSVSILLRGRTLYVSNVGDSRAILVSKKDGRLVAKPLSNDQTPYRKDERERIKKTGARVLSMDQIEGMEPVHENWGDLNLGEDIDEGGDPPRVWSAHGDYPGTAFTRSIGDRVAEDCGVFAEPEILERDLEPDDVYVVIASDGVFEFITNQMVADEFAFHDNPLVACKAVVAQAYHLWLQYEVRTDDITMIAMYLDDVPAPEAFAPSSSFYVKNEGEASSDAVMQRQASLELSEQRPVRRVMSREKRKHMIEVQLDPIGDEADDDITEAEMKSLLVPKSEEDAELIGSAIKSNFLFQHLNATQRAAVIDVMKEVTVKAGDRVIRQGDRGDRFYVIDHGRFEVRVRPSLPPPSPSTEDLQKLGREKSNSVTIMVERAPTASKIAFEPNAEVLGNVVHIYESNANSHPGFGELSLMYGKPRAASVIALTDGKLWSLDRRVFARVVLRPKDIRRSSIRTLKNVQLLKCLTLDQMQRLTDLLCEETHPAGSYIIRQGEAGENFYIIVSGTAECTINREDGSGSYRVLGLKEHDYFGERALLEAKPRAANVIATTDVKVLYINKRSFEEVLGSLSSIIDNDRIRREAIAAAASSTNVPHKFSDMTIYGIVTTDVLGTLFMGTFGEKASNGKVEPNVTVRTFLLSQVERRSLKDSLSRFMDAVKVVLLAAPSTVLIPRPMSFIQERNAVHITFNQPIVADLSSFVRSNSGVVVASPAMVSFSFACLVSVLEALHAMQIVYRAVQPESLYVDAMGRIVVLDYRVCKIGLSGTGRTFTICGVSDYLAPEQIAQSGHSYPVDLWGMGVLLYEVSVGSHPFSASSEVATYSKISSFGTKSFPSLDIPETVAADCKSLINQLLVPVPSARIGAGNSGFAALRRHAFFKTYADQWPAIASGTYESPFASMAKNEKDAMMLEVVDPAEFETFCKEYSGRTITEDWVGNLAF